MKKYQNVTRFLWQNRFHTLKERKQNFHAPWKLIYDINQHRQDFQGNVSRLICEPHFFLLFTVTSQFVRAPLQQLIYHKYRQFKNNKTHNPCGKKFLSTLTLATLYRNIISFVRIPAIMLKFFCIFFFTFKA